MPEMSSVSSELWAKSTIQSSDLQNDIDKLSSTATPYTISKKRLVVDESFCTHERIPSGKRIKHSSHQSLEKILSFPSIAQSISSMPDAPLEAQGTPCSGERLQEIPSNRMVKVAQQRSFPRLLDDFDDDDVVDPLFLIDDVNNTMPSQIKARTENPSTSNQFSQSNLKSIVAEVLSHVKDDICDECPEVYSEADPSSSTLLCNREFEPTISSTGNLNTLASNCSTQSQNMFVATTPSQNHDILPQSCSMNVLLLPETKQIEYAPQGQKPPDSHRNQEKNLVPNEDTCEPRSVSSTIPPGVTNISINDVMKLRNGDDPVLITLTSFPFRILHANDAYIKMSGQKNLIGRTMFDIFVREPGARAPSIVACSSPLGNNFPNGRVRLSFSSTELSCEASASLFGNIRVFSVSTCPKTPEKGIINYAVVLNEVKFCDKAPQCIYLPCNSFAV